MRIAGLDGLRAVAVTGVLLYHGGVSAVPGGFLGVDLFFVISGFLITTLLLDEANRRAGAIDVIAFWTRRARRLLPALLVVIALTVVVFSSVSTIADSEGLGRDAVAALLYVANWNQLSGGDGYFEALAAPSPVQHTWSLAIEEQFYLVWPLLLLVILRWRLPRWAQVAVVTSGAVVAVSWTVHLATRGAGTDRLYYGTDTRAPAILFGVLAALLLERVVAGEHASRRGRPSRLSRRLTTAAGWAALAAVVGAMATVDSADGRLFRGGLLLFGAVSTALVAAVVRSPTGALTRALESAPMRAGGVLSYGLYLWHWPVFLLLSAGRTSLGGWALLAVRLTAALALAAASYRLVEAPARLSTWRPPRLVAAPVGVTAVACGLALVTPAHVWEQDARSGSLAVRSAPSVAASDTGRPPSGDPGRSPPSIVPSATTRSAEKPHRLRVTILGDSTAATLADGLRDRPGLQGIDFHDASSIGCGLTTAMPYRYMGEITPYERRRCRTWAARWRRVAVSRRADVVAVLVGRWEVADQVVDGTWTHVGKRVFDAYLRDELEQAVRAASAGGARVAFLTAPYCSRGEQPDGSIWPEDEPARVEAFNRLLRSVAAKHPGQVGVIELGGRMSGGRREYVAELDDVVLRYDGVHFTAEAGRWVQPWLEAALSRVARSD